VAEYLILIYEDERSYAEADQKTWDSVMAAHQEFGAKHGGAIRGGNALQPSGTATKVVHGDSGTLVTDGPFAETKEALGGYYLVEAANLDEALTIAKDVPAGFGGVEVRPIMTFE
jgi:hypothetical protein